MKDYNITLTVLGCGSSAGTPVINCNCAVCRSNNSKNYRKRCSAHIKVNNKSFIIDTGPDFRMQTISYNVKFLSGVLYTHFHADHMNGIDDLRAFCYQQKEVINIYGNKETIDNIEKRFDYVFAKPNEHWNRPVLKPNILREGINVIEGIDVETYSLPHGNVTTNIYRFGSIAWVADINFIDDNVILKLKNLDYLFLDCLMYPKYFSHLSVDEAFSYAKLINAKETYLIGMTHMLDYDELSKACPENIKVAYDGLKVNIK